MLKNPVAVHNLLKDPQVQKDGICKFEEFAGNPTENSIAEMFSASGGSRWSQVYRAAGYGASGQATCRRSVWGRRSSL